MYQPQSSTFKHKALRKFAKFDKPKQDQINAVRKAEYNSQVRKLETQTECEMGPHEAQL